VRASSAARAREARKRTNKAQNVVRRGQQNTQDSTPPQTTTPAKSHTRVARAHIDRPRPRLADARGSARGERGGLETSTAGRTIDLRHDALRQAGEPWRRKRPRHVRSHTCSSFSPASCTRRAHLSEPAVRRASWGRGKWRKRHENQFCTPTCARKRAATARETRETHDPIVGPHTGNTRT